MKIKTLVAAMALGLGSLAAVAPPLPSTSAYRLDMSVMKPIFTFSCA